MSKWRLSDEDLLSVLYVLDTCCDLISGIRFLLWLLAKVRAGLGSSSQSGRNAMHMKNREHQVCQVSEALVLSSLLRYVRPDVFQIFHATIYLDKWEAGHQ